MVSLKINKSKYFSNVGYIPEQVQWDVHNSDARFRVNIEGRRSGKSYSAAKEAEVVFISPNTRQWIVAPTYDMGDKIAREFDATLIKKVGFPCSATHYDRGRLRYAKGINGSELWVKSADAPESLLGEGLDNLIVDEAATIPKIIWEQYLRPTLSDRNGRALFPTTPRGYNWIYDLYRLGKSDNKSYDAWQHPSWMSQYFKDDIDALRAELSDATFRQEYGAEFTTYAGKVYPFDRDKQVKVFKYDKALPTYVSIDFGYRMPSVGWFQVASVKGMAEVYLIDEIVHQENIKTASLAQMILKRNRDKGYNIHKYYGDPAGAGVQAQSGLGDIEIFRQNGIRVNYTTNKVDRDISTGIDHVRSFMENANGVCRFYVDSRCIGHIDDFENYRYPEAKAGRALKEEPMKDGHHDHSMDETRYFFINHFPIKKRGATSIKRY
jgi:hypothetical protein